MRSNDWYLEKLKEKEIKIIPLEKYKGIKTKILHKCKCGKEWKVIPNNILRQTKCNHKNNDWYLKKLKEKEIKVIPLEKYIDSQTKILHKCSCGNEWNILPLGVLSGRKCGCEINPCKPNDWYLNKLKEKGIKVIPVEQYVNTRTKILHKCICNNEWSVSPMSVLNNNKCGCKKRLSYRDESFYKGKETILYYIKLTSKDKVLYKVLYKVGVTLFKESIENSMKLRFNKELSFIEIQKTEVFQDGAEAFLLEQKIINENWKYKYEGEKVLKSGNTELFIEDIRK